MHCFACLEPRAEFTDANICAAFCDVSCQERFYIGGAYVEMLSRPTWNKDVFVKIIQETTTPFYPYHLSFIDGLLADANEAQRETIFHWMLDDDNVRALVFRPGVEKYRTIVYLFQRAIENDLRNLLYYVPIDTLEDKRNYALQFLRQAARKGNVDFIRILHLRFTYSVNEFVNDAIAYASPNLKPREAIEFLKMFGSLVNDEGKRMVQQFVNLLRVGERDMDTRTIQFTRDILKAFEIFIMGVNIPIEPDTNVKKLKKK